MADVIERAEMAQRIERDLAQALDQWRQLPDIANEWHHWPVEARHDFIFEWPVAEGRLSWLLRWAELGLLSSEQASRLEELQNLVAEHRPTLDRLLTEIPSRTQ